MTPPLRIGVDARELLGDATGVGQYLGELMRRWTARPDAAARRFLLYTPEPLPLRLPPDTCSTVVAGRGTGTWWEQLALGRAVRADRPDVFFAPAYTAPLGLAMPLAVTIHDVSFVAHPEWFRRREGARRRWLTRRAAERAAVVFTDSQFSRGEIEQRLHVDPGKIRVIAPGVPSRAAASRHDSRSPVVLFVGSVFNRRRLPDLIAAFARATAALPSARLVIVGADRTWPPQDLAAVARTNGVQERTEFRSYVSDDELGQLYARASVFAFLSEYEGFGLTPLEALAAGIPAVVLDTPVAREVYGEAAAFVRRGDIDGTADALRRFLTSPEAGRDVLARAPEVLARYSWDAAADETLAHIERGGAAMTRLSIVIVSYNARVHLENCLRSLAAAPPAMPHEIVVVDNASSDGSVEAVRECSRAAASEGRPPVQLIAQAANTGFAAANNAGIRATSGALILLLNSDTVVPEGAIDALAARLLARPEAAVAGPRLVDGEGVAELSFGPMISPLGELRQKIVMGLHHRRVKAVSDRVERATRREQFVDWVSGACLLVHRDAAERAGLLDERYFLYTEDVDFCAAIRAQGRRILFAPSAQVVHLRGRSRATAPAAMNVAYRRSHLAFYEKHHPAWAPVLRAYLRLKGQLPR